MEDSRALAAGAMALEGSCRQLEGLRARPGSSGLGSMTAGAPRDGERTGNSSCLPSEDTGRAGLGLPSCTCSASQHFSRQAWRKPAALCDGQCKRVPPPGHSRVLC